MKSDPQSHSSWWLCVRALVFSLATLATVIALFYVIENWRGRRAWEKYKGELTARGEKLELGAYVRPPVPPDQNFAETPVLRAIAYKDRMDHGVWAKFQAVHGIQSFMPIGKDEVRSENAVEALGAFKDIEPELTELRAAANRPFAQFTNNNPNAFLSDIPHFIVLRTLTQLFTIHASAELASGHSDRAFEDLHVVRRITDALSNQSTLVSAMIRVAILGLVLQPFESGLSTNAWSDEQLVAFQKYFESLDLLADMDVALRGGERNGVTHLVSDLPRQQLTETMTSAGSKDWKDHCFKLAVRWCPRGWLFQNATSYSRTMQTFFEGYDVRQQRVFPDKLAHANRFLEEEMERVTPFKYLMAIGIPNFTKAVQATAQSHSSMQEAALACALERYRRAHSQYPEGLAALVPQFIEKIPRDVMTGESLKYQRTDDGKFLLYSVGWNLKDEGGTRTSDRAQGDWAWPPIR